MTTQDNLLFLIETGKPLEIKRAMAVRMSIQGYRRAEIAETLGVSIPFIDKWKPVYFEKGIDGLKLHYKGSQGYLSKQERQSIIEYIQSVDTITTDELKDYIMTNYGVFYNSPKSYTDFLHEAKYSYKKTEKVNPKGDEEQIETKKKEIQSLVEENAEDIKNGSLIIWMQDECHQLWGDTCGYVWGKIGERLNVPMTNFRERQTWYGALNCYTGQFFLDEYDAGNTKNTIDFVKKIVQKHPNSRHVLIWDGAPCHRSKEFKKYLNQINKDLPESEWKVRCIRFAPNAPQQNPVEDIWLYGKTWLRKNFASIHVFDEAIQIFRDCLSGEYFSFDKLKNYITL